MSVQGKTSYNWRLYGTEAGTLLSRILPYMLIKQEQASLALEFLQFKRNRGLKDCGTRLNNEAIIQRTRIANEMRILNRLNGKAQAIKPNKGVI